MLFPELLEPTTATVFPALTEKLKFSKIILLLEGQVKQTSQKSIFPATCDNTKPSSNILDDSETDAIMFMILAAAVRPLAMEPMFGAA